MAVPKDVWNVLTHLRCGPMLSYYTVRDGVWHGAALVVTADK